MLLMGIKCVALFMLFICFICGIIWTCALFLCALLQLYANRYALPLLTRPQRQKRQNTEQKVNDVFQPVISSFFFCACETHSFDVLMRKEHETQSNNKCWMLKNELPKMTRWKFFFYLIIAKQFFSWLSPFFHIIENHIHLFRLKWCHIQYGSWTSGWLSFCLTSSSGNEQAE